MRRRLTGECLRVFAHAGALPHEGDGGVVRHVEWLAVRARKECTDGPVAVAALGSSAPEDPSCRPHGRN